MDNIEFLIERLILKAGNAINNIRSGDLSASGLTSAQSETVLFYDKNPGSSIKELAGHLKITHQAARKLVDKLRLKGIVEQRTSQSDRRVSRVFLTHEGEKLCEMLKRGGTTTGERVLTGFTDDEKKTLLLLLRRIEKNIDGE